MQRWFELKIKKAGKLLIGLRDIVILVVVVVAITAWQSRHLLESDGTVELNNIRLVELSGSTENLLTGEKQTLLYFFAPWCKICSLSIGNLDYLSSENINIVTVAMDYQSVEEVQLFVDKNQVKSLVLLGTEDLKSTFKINGYPTYYLINTQSQVISSSFGYSSAIGLKLTQFFNSQG
ncbi:MAG: thiol-disulfide isomerase/thioredoxin [Paraglaciecola sp.]